jgi:hypothetical protein
MAISGGLASKERCPRACAAWGRGMLEIGGSRTRTYHTWRRPLRCIWIDSWRGFPSAHERRPAPPAWLRWRLPLACPKLPLLLAMPLDFPRGGLGVDGRTSEIFSTTKIRLVVSHRMPRKHGLTLPDRLLQQQAGHVLSPAGLAHSIRTFIETHRLQLQQSPLAKIDLS